MAKILVVDDDRSMRSSLRRHFKTEGYEVTAVANGIEALDAIEKEAPFGLIVSDYNMPRMSGTVLLGMLRGRDDQTPFILHTAANDESLKEFCKRSDAHLVEKSPRGTTKLLELVKSLVAKK